MNKKLFGLEFEYVTKQSLNLSQNYLKPMSKKMANTTFLMDNITILPLFLKNLKWKFIFFAHKIPR